MTLFDRELTNDMLTQKRIRTAALILVFILAAGYLYLYLAKTNDEMPLMDFYLGFEEFADKVFSNQLTTADFFTIPHALHWNPVGAVMLVFYMKVFHCNNLAYVYTGMVFLLCSVALVLRWLAKRVQMNRLLPEVFFGIVCAMCLLNLNQWEILDLYCSPVFMLRLFCYLLTFYLLDGMLLKPDTDMRRNVLKSCGLGLLSAVIVIILSAAYYPGYVAAVTAILVLYFFLSKDSKTVKYTRIPILVLLIAGAAFTFLTTASNSGIANGTVNISDYIKGFFVMLGSTVIPLELLNEGYTVHIAAGIVIFLLTVESLVVFFKDKLYTKSWLPLGCLVYAGVSVIIIIYGRADSLGFGTVVSSRYVTETTLGLLGIVMIQAMFVSNHLGVKRRGPVIACTIGVAVSLCVTGLLILANAAEQKTGPYRKIYYQSMAIYAMDIDNATDEQLSLFQAPANEVRNAVRAMKKYKLCLWNEGSAYYPQTSLQAGEGN